MNAFLDVSVEDKGQIGGGKRKPTSIIDVATVQSLGRKGVVDDIVAKYGHLVVDECHHISARSFEIVSRQCKAGYVTGLSATVIRKEGRHPIIFMNCGPVRYKVDDKNRRQQDHLHTKSSLERQTLGCRHLLKLNGTQLFKKFIKL